MLGYRDMFRKQLEVLFSVKHSPETVYSIVFLKSIKQIIVSKILVMFKV